MIGYKAFDKGWVCRGFQYEIGKTYKLGEDEKLSICECGFHFCDKPIDVFGYYSFDANTVIAKIEALGNIIQEGTKYVTDEIKILEEFPREALNELMTDDCHNTGYNNVGNFNSGSRNVGDYNSGYDNTGRCNSGRRNSGAGNAGDYNTGSNNLGDCNTGACNDGYGNAGDYNTGNYNTGDFNSGDYNAGFHNSGFYNAGDFNIGHHNTGVFNISNHNTGMFNTTEPTMRLFNKDTGMTHEELYEYFDSIDLNVEFLCERIRDKKLFKGDVEKIKALPNFDPAIFYDITGIDIEKDV